jgi:hypothetical protein
MTLLLCCPPPACLALSNPSSLSSWRPLPAHLAPPPPPPPSRHVICRLTAAHAGVRHLLPPQRQPSCCIVRRPLASRCLTPPPSCCVVRFSLASLRPLRPPTLVMSSAACPSRMQVYAIFCCQDNNPLVVSSAARLPRVVRPLPPETPTGQLASCHSRTDAPRRSRTNQVAQERPPAGNELINQDGYVCRHLPPHNSANRPTHQMSKGNQKLLAMGISMN